MGYLSDFEHDVFVSYAHIDNEPDREGDRGWVEVFSRSLQMRLLKRFGQEVAVWRDPELGRAQRFDPVIESAAKGSGIILSLITRSYLASDYCAQELEWFSAKAASGKLGLTVGDHVRVFPVLLYNVPPSEWPEACQRTSGFRFHDSEDKSFGKPLDPTGDEFTDQLCSLVEELHTVLAAIEQTGAEPQQAPEAKGPERAVFLAEVSDEMRRDRRDLRQRLQKEGIEVVTTLAPPNDLASHEAAVREAVKRARLSVHLLGTLPGRPFDDDDPDTTYPVEQLRVGLEHSPSQLVVLPPGFDTADIEEPGYASLITSLQERQREAEALQILQTGRAELSDAVLTKLRRLEAEEAARQVVPHEGGDGGTAFVDLHVNDLAYAGDLVGYLHQQRVAPITIPSADVDPTEGMSMFAQHLASSRVFIVVFGSVARNWVEQRLNEAFKLILSNRLTTKVGVYLAPPHKTRDDAAFPPFFQIMDNSEQFDPKTVDALLRGPAEQE